MWGYAAVVGTRTVDVHVAQVRAKLGDASPIRTVRGVGYSAETRVTPDGDAAPTATSLDAQLALVAALVAAVAVLVAGARCPTRWWRSASADPGARPARARRPTSSRDVAGACRTSGVMGPIDDCARLRQVLAAPGHHRRGRAAAAARTPPVTEADLAVDRSRAAR